MVDFPLRSVDKEVHQLKLTIIITERGGVGGCSRNLCNPHSNLSGMFTGILHLPTIFKSMFENELPQLVLQKNAQ